MCIGTGVNVQYWYPWMRTWVFLCQLSPSTVCSGGDITSYSVKNEKHWTKVWTLEKVKLVQTPRKVPISRWWTLFFSYFFLPGLFTAHIVCHWKKRTFIKPQFNKPQCEEQHDSSRSLKHVGNWRVRLCSAGHVCIDSSKIKIYDLWILWLQFECPIHIYG